MSPTLSVRWLSFRHSGCNLWLVFLLCFLQYRSSVSHAQDIVTTPQPLQRYEYVTATMGTMLKIVVYADDDDHANQVVDAGLIEIERLMPIVSNYDDRSEIMRLNATHKVQVPVSGDLASLLSESKSWHERSRGAFDVTAGPLIQLWRQARRTKTLPDPNLIREAKNRMGWTMVSGWTNETRPIDKHPEISADSAAMRVSLGTEGMLIDLSGLATGYIIDRAFEAMVRRGCPRLLIDIGGDIRVGAAPPGSSGWLVLVAGLGKESPPICSLSLENCAVTTSGDLTQFVEIDGVRYSHLVDPRAGVPLTRRQSVTVLATTAIDADAGATALSVLGMEISSELFETLPLREAILLEADTNSTGDDAALRYRHLSIEER